jgi:type VI secretion system protein ImpL
LDLIRSIITQHQVLVLYGIVATITGGAAMMWSKYPVRWILLLLTVGVLIFSYSLTVPDIDSKLPAIFREKMAFKIWVLVLSLITLYTLVHLGSVLIKSLRKKGEDKDAAPPRFPDLEGAWDEILMRLGQASYDTSSQKLYLLLAPDETLSESMVQASGVNIFATAPSAPEAPIHAYATTDGLFISCAGASAWGRQDAEGTERLKDLCQKILALNPEQPTLRGVAVLYPMEKTAVSGALQKVGPLRNDLQTIWSGLTLRCPVFAVLCLHESRSGFNEFARRMPDTLRHNRCGFSVPVVLPFTKEVAQRGLNWFAQWFQSWSLNLMVQDYVNKDGNARLVEMNAQMRRDLPALRDLLDASFSTHVRAEPTLVRGCYFVACGPEPENHAFVAGLVRGPKSKMIADAPFTSWSGGAEEIERKYRRTSLALGLAAAAITLPIWFIGIYPRLMDSKVGLKSLYWAGLGLLAGCWLVGLCFPMIHARWFKPVSS